jgi:HK97 family phage major capsid protein
MSDLATIMTTEQKASAKALLDHVAKGSAEYVKENVTNPIQRKIDEICATNASISQKIAAIEEAQKAYDEKCRKEIDMQSATYKSFFDDAQAGRHKKGIDQPRAGKIMMAFLTSIYKAGDGIQAAARLRDFEKEHGMTFPELANTFNAMGTKKSIVTIGNPQEGGFSVPTPLMQEWIEGLYSRLFWEKLGVRSIDMPNGNMRMVKVGKKSTATYTGEAQPAVNTNAQLELLNWSARKLTAILAYSKDVFLASSPGIDLIMQDDLTRVMMRKKEYTSLYGSGESSIPKGLAKLGIPTIGSSSTALTRDIPFDMLGTIASTDVVDNFGWLCHPMIFYYLMNLKTTTGAFIYRDEMSKGTLCGYPIAHTTQSYFNNTGTKSTSYGDLWLANWNELIVGTFRNMEVTVSQEGSYIDADGNMINAFANDLILVKFIDCHDFNTRHKEAFLQGSFKTAES